MSSSKLRVVFARNPPDVYSNCPRFPTLSPRSYCPFPGWCAEILKMMVDAMDIDIEIIVAPYSTGLIDWGTYQEDTDNWEGVLGYIQNGTADTACLMYQKTDLRERFFDFSYPVANVQPVYVVRQHEESIGSMLFNVFKPYSLTIWLGFLASLIINMIWMIILTRFEFAMNLRSRFRAFETFWRMIELQLNEQSQQMVFYTLSGKLVMTTFAVFQCGLFIALYKAILLTALLKSNIADPFKNADELINLIESKKFQMTTNYMGNWYFDDLRDSMDEHFVKLREATKSNPVVVTESIQEALDLVDNGHHVFPIQQDSLAFQMSKQRCNYVYVSEGLPQVPAYFVFSKNSSIKQQFDHQIIMQQSFIQRTFSKYFLQEYKIGDTPTCSDKSQYSGTTKPLSLISTIGVFTIGGLGIASSIVIFIVEIIVNWIQLKYQHYQLKQQKRRRTNQRSSQQLASDNCLLTIAQQYFQQHQPQ